MHLETKNLKWHQFIYCEAPKKTTKNFQRFQSYGSGSQAAAKQETNASVCRLLSKFGYFLNVKNYIRMINIFSFSKKMDSVKISFGIILPN